MKYNQVIELEFIDPLISVDTKLIIACLLSMTRKLNNDDSFKDDFSFHIIKYGFQGYYPALGVVYLKHDQSYHEIKDHLEEVIERYFINFISSTNFKEFLDFFIGNRDYINSIYLDIIT